MKIHKNPKLFEYDADTRIVDIFVKKDPDCPYPFHEDDWWHQGFPLKQFIVYINDFFERHELPFEVMRCRKNE